MPTIEVFADIACPFAHVGLRRYVTEREARGLVGPRLRLRAWPLELVNGAAHDGPKLAPEIAALRSSVAPGRFAGFDAAGFPTTSLLALAAEAAAHRAGPEVGEAFSLRVRDALFEEGLDIADPAVVAGLLADAGLPPATEQDAEAVRAAHRDGKARGVVGSPHFFTDRGDFFCPSLEIGHDDDDGISVVFDPDTLDRFLAAAFG